jgi:arylsulfatase A-like enzyme
MEWANPGGASLTRWELATMTAGYYGMVSQLDHAIGRVLEVLDERGLRHDTLVLVTTDHGELLGDHQMVFKGPLHYEGLLRVPLIVRGPGVVPGTVLADPVGTIDLAPTALVAAGLDVPEYMEGEPLLDGSRREHVLTENDHQMVFRLSLRTITTSRYKLTWYRELDDVGELYDLDEDPGELVNRWADPGRAAVRADLLATLRDCINSDVKSGPMVGVVA